MTDHLMMTCAYRFSGRDPGRCERDHSFLAPTVFLKLLQGLFYLRNS
jgi:hypothetical protein